ncbi:MAG: hypothetical protein LCH38_14755 [Proteobacteria bacterium]|nr:hypothetical protein [Pseudomonadota bacterium]
MVRFVLGLFATISFFGAVFAGLDVLFLEGSSGTTVFQQLVIRTSFGFSVLALILSLGFVALINAAQRRPDLSAEQLKALKEIASDAAAVRFALEAPMKEAEAKRQEEEESEKKERYAAYRKSLQPGGRITAEAAMLANMQSKEK